MKREPPAEELPGSPRAIHDPESNPGPMEAIAGEDEDEALKMAVVLSREEVLRRRSRRLKQLERCYREQYWALMEELRVRHRDYYWEFGKSPFDGQKGENVVFAAVGEGSEEVAKDGVGGLGFGGGEAGKKGERERCGVSGCKVYAMPLTRFCHSHILLDGKQMLYKGCSYVIKRYWILSMFLFLVFFTVLFRVLMVVCVIGFDFVAVLDDLSLCCFLIVCFPSSC